MTTVRKMNPKKERDIAVRHTLRPNPTMEEMFADFMPQKWLERFFEPGMSKWPLRAETGMQETMGVDVIDRENELHVRAELPGIRRKDLEITVSGDYLQIEANRKFERTEEKETYFRNELGFGNFSRMVYLPCEVDTAKAEAKLVDGILELSLPKVKAQKRHTIKVA